jgi:hypothetical protein
LITSLLLRLLTTKKGVVLPMILLDESKTVAIWHASLNENSDFMGCLQHPDDPEKDSEGNPRAPGGYDFNCRFRYYKDDLVFESDDDKHWYHIELGPMPREEAIAKIRLATEAMTRITGDNPHLDELIFDGDWHTFYEKFKSMPWAHVRVEEEHHA